MSTAYHLQIDGQMKVLNQTLEQYLCAYVHHQPSSEWSYNTTIHAGTGISPFKAIYGKSPPTIAQYLQGNSSIDVVDSLLTSRMTIRAQLQWRLRKAQEVMKATGNKHR